MRVKIVTRENVSMPAFVPICSQNNNELIFLSSPEKFASTQRYVQPTDQGVDFPSPSVAYPLYILLRASSPYFRARCSNDNKTKQENKSAIHFFHKMKMDSKHKIALCLDLLKKSGHSDGKPPLLKQLIRRRSFFLLCSALFNTWILSYWHYLHFKTMTCKI